MKNLMDATRLHMGLVDIDTYAIQLHLFSKQKKLIFRKYLESQGVEIISIGGDAGRADLANRDQIANLLNTLHARSSLNELLNESTDAFPINFAKGSKET